MINIGTDGACKGNPGVGGWGVAVYSDSVNIESMYGGELLTTNNRMELTAFIRACHYISDSSIEEDVTMHIDSQYVIRGCTEWLRGWRSKDYKGVKNEDLWKEIAELRDIWSACDLKWVKGHSGDMYNERADLLANKGCEDVVFDNDGW